MAEKDTMKTPTGGELQVIEPAPTRRLRLPLKTVEHVRRELARVYRAAKTGQIQTQDATRLTYILIALKNTIETGELEQRISKLEEEAWQSKS